MKKLLFILILYSSSVTAQKESKSFSSPKNISAITTFLKGKWTFAERICLSKKDSLIQRPSKILSSAKSDTSRPITYLNFLDSNKAVILEDYFQAPLGGNDFSWVITSSGKNYTSYLRLKIHSAYKGQNLLAKEFSGQIIISSEDKFEIINKNGCHYIFLRYNGS